eukprot:3295870-Karenia_brevis.AAC.1
MNLVQPTQCVQIPPTSMARHSLPSLFVRPHSKQSLTNSYTSGRIYTLGGARGEASRWQPCGELQGRPFPAYRSVRGDCFSPGYPKAR